MVWATNNTIRRSYKQAKMLARLGVSWQDSSNLSKVDASKRIDELVKAQKPAIDINALSMAMARFLSQGK